MKIFKDQILKDTGILFLANSLANFFNFAFQLVMVRALTTVDYGIFNSLISIFVILSISFNTLQTLITKFVSEFLASQDIDKVKYFLIHLGKRLFLLALGFFVIFVLFNNPISKFLNITGAPSLIMLLAGSISLAMLLPIGLGGLQGMQRFGYLGLNGILGGFLKLLSGIILVKIGLGIFGAMSAFLFSILVSIIAAFIPLYKISQDSQGSVSKLDVDFIQIYKFVFPIAITLFCVMAMTNIDVILVKHYFTAFEAGLYSIAQLVGKIIFFLPAILVTVIFPKSARFYAQRKDSLPLLIKGLKLMLLAAGTAAIACLFIPEIILKILSGKVYPQALILVRLFSIVMIPFTMINLILYFFLSINKTKFIYPLILCTILEILLITIFHSRLEFVLYIMLGISLLLLTILFLLLKYEGVTKMPPSDSSD